MAFPRFGINRVYESFLHGLLTYINGQRLLNFQFDITNACNLSCVHCYHPNHKNEGALDREGWFSILDECDRLLNKLHLRPRVIFCGGEPLVSPLLKPLIQELHRRWPDVQMTILTNGTLFRFDDLDFFGRHPISFQISMDGPDPARHDSIRGTGSFDRTMKGIELLSNSERTVWILAVLSKRTSEWIGDFFKMAKERKISSMNFTRFIPQGEGKRLVDSERDRPLAPPELKTAMETIVAESKKYEIPTNTDAPLYHLIEPSMGANGRWGCQGVIIDYQGNLKVSSRTNYRLGNIMENGLEPLFLHHPLMKALRNGQVDICGKCTYYRRCGGDRNAAYAEFGSFLAWDPGCWYVQKR